jgi:glycosyltransferase involved in cell wall biosynthesis
MSKPELSIVMPLYNSEKFVGKAVESLLSQSYGDFELIIVNDCSTDGSMEALKQFNDRRISILHNQTNQGIVFSRNKGLEAASGAFIAPFDSDDVALPDKFKLQIDFLKKHANYGLIGSWVQMIDEHGILLKKSWKLNAKPEQIPAILFFRNYFVQSAVTMRQEAIPKQGYRKGYDLVEDWMMWHEIAAKYPVWNLPEYLVKYRVHQQGNSQNDPAQLSMKDKLMFEYLFQNLGLHPANNDFELYSLIKSKQPVNHR